MKTRFTFAGTMRHSGEYHAVIRSSGTGTLYITGELLSGTISGGLRGAMEFSLERDVEWFDDSAAGGTLETMHGPVKVQIAFSVKSELIPSSVGVPFIEMPHLSTENSRQAPESRTQRCRTDEPRPWG